MDQLPKCLFKEGTEILVKVNNTCRATILQLVKESIPAEYSDVLDDPLFAQVMAISDHKLGYSGTVIHTLVCRQLLTAKRHELWFRFATRPLRFSMQEFYAITGLKYEDEPDMEIDDWKSDKGFWSLLLKKRKNISLQQIRKVHLKKYNTWSHVDRLRLVYLCVIASMVMAKDEKVWIPHKYIKLVMDFEKMRKYPWGLHSFNMLVSSIIDAREKVQTKKSYVIDGFSYALQIWAMEAIPDIGTLLGQKLDDGIISMRCRNWKGSSKISYDDIISLESDFSSTGFVFPSISSTGNFPHVIVEDEFVQVGEMNDERVDLIIDMYRNNYDWSKHVWAYNETRQPYMPSSDEEDTEAEEVRETTENEMEEETESAAASVQRKRKKKFHDTGVESRKKKLLFQRSADKYRELEEEMKSYIHGMFKASFTSLALEVRKTIEDRFTKFEEKLLAYQNPGPSHAPAPTDTPIAIVSAATASLHTPGAATPADAPSRSRAPVSSRSGGHPQTGGPANAAKTRSKSKVNKK